MKKLFMTLATTLFVLCVMAQSRVSISSMQHDFGTIEEAGGVVRCEFIVRNTSLDPVVINRVQSTCSCVTSRYSRKPILPHASDTLRVTFDPRFRAGAISRTISLQISGDSLPITLSLRGYVTPR